MRYTSYLLLVIAIALCGCTAPPPLSTPTPEPTRLPTVIHAIPTLATATPELTPVPTSTPTLMPTATPLPAVHPLFDPQRLSYDHNFSGPEIQAFLEARNSPLATARISIGNRSHSFTDVLVSLSNLYSISPRLLLSLMDLQSGVLSTSTPSSEQLAWAAGFQGDNGSRRGLFAQLRWLTRELRAALRDYALLDGTALPPLNFVNGSVLAVPSTIDLSRYVLSRALAPTTTPDRLDALLTGVAPTYQRLFDLDPRLAPTDWPPLAEPFLSRPFERNFPVTSFFDHDTPFLRPNGSLHTFWGVPKPTRLLPTMVIPVGIMQWDHQIGYWLLHPVWSSSLATLMMAVRPRLVQ